MGWASWVSSRNAISNGGSAGGAPAVGLQQASRWLAGLTCVALVGLAGLTTSSELQARSPETLGAAQAVSLSTLPPEALATHRLILNGGPFPYDKDGTVFRNRERLLPPKARGHYREYTVRTPGLRNRGARRIVCGGKPPSRPEACFYTDDHYASFRLIQP